MIKSNNNKMNKNTNNEKCIDLEYNDKKQQ